MQYTLSGFTHESGVRVFAFVCIADDHQKTEYRVRADMALIARYGIRVQDLPLLCQGILERRAEGDERRSFTYTETDMRRHADARAVRDAEAEKKRPSRRVPPRPANGPWRDGSLSLGRPPSA